MAGPSSQSKLGARPTPALKVVNPYIPLPPLWTCNLNLKPSPTPQLESPTSSLTSHLSRPSPGVTLPGVPTGDGDYWQKGSLTFHSNPATAKPLAAPVPARPTKWPLPILLAKREAPTWVARSVGEPDCFSRAPPDPLPFYCPDFLTGHHTMLRPARK